MKELFFDPTPGGLINQRAVMPFVMMLGDTTLDEACKARLLDLLVLVGRKLVGVWRHLEAYRTIENTLVTEEQERDLQNDAEVVELRYSQDLFLEFDGFLVQIKSALDYLVKVPIPIVGGGKWTLRGFGDKGDAVLRAVSGCLSAGDRRQMVPYMDRVLQEHRPWLTQVIAARDRTNHFLDGGIPYEQFLVRKIRRNHVEGVYVPMWNDSQQMVEAMEAVWGRLVSLAEDFCGGFLNLRLRPELGLFHASVPDGVPQTVWRLVNRTEMDALVRGSGWKVTTEEDVKNRKKLVPSKETKIDESDDGTAQRG